MTARLLKSFVFIFIALVCFSKVYALDMADVSPETLEIMRNNPGLLEKYQDELNSSKTGKENRTGSQKASDRNSRIQDRQLPKNLDNLTGYDNGTAFPVQGNATAVFPPKPAVPDPFVKNSSGT